MMRATVGLVAFELARGLYFTNRDTQSVTVLTQEDFRHGTVRILASGTYRLGEDVVFEPERDASMSWSMFPEDSSTYRHNGGYVVGFFAAIAVEADDVEIDCQNYSLSMSEAYHKMQRYFSLVEVASSPFSPRAAPPFYNPNKPNVTPVNPGNFLIQNCDLGLTSHYAIHTSGNSQLTLRNLKIHDFEGGGIEINGNVSTSILIENCDIGPSIQGTYGMGLYHAMIMDHHCNTRMIEDANMEALANSTDVTLRGETRTVRGWLDTLRTALKTYIENSTGPMAAVAGDGTWLPHGSGVYGILVHSEISHVNTLQDLFCPDNYLCDPDPEVEQRVHDFSMKNVTIHDLSVKVAQKADVYYNTRPQRGISGDLFDMAQSWAPENCYHYVGNVLTDAQLAVGELAQKARREAGRRKSEITEATVNSFLGNAYIAPQVRAWARGGDDAGGLSCHGSGDFILKIWKGAKKEQPKQNISCRGDAYGCRNIGAVGIRLDFVRDVEVVNVTLGNFTNYGEDDAAPWCSMDSYTGRDVRGVSTTFVQNLSSIRLTQRGTFTSVYGGEHRVYPGFTASKPISP